MSELSEVQKTANKAEILAGMDASAEEAAKDLAAMCKAGSMGSADALQNLADWWDKWFVDAGHKRLGRVILTYKSTGG